MRRFHYLPVWQQHLIAFLPPVSTFGACLLYIIMMLTNGAAVQVFVRIGMDQKAYEDPVLELTKLGKRCYLLFTYSLHSLTNLFNLPFKYSHTHVHTPY